MTAYCIVQQKVITPTDAFQRKMKMAVCITKEVWARRLALQITTQLPESEEEAIEVLKYARDLLGFVSRGRFNQPFSVVVSNNSDQKT